MARETQRIGRTVSALLAVLALLALLALAACSGSGDEPNSRSSTSGSAAASSTTTEAAEAEQPNIVFVLTDDQTLADLEYMPKVQASLAEQGATFDNAFVSVSLCCPSRATILRGQYSHNTGVMTNGGTNGGFETAYALEIEESTVATWLHDAGYRTALIGKYLNGYPGTAGPAYVPPGWDTWASAAGGRPYSEYDYTLNEDGQVVEYGHEPDDYGTDVYARKAVEFVDGAAGDDVPFFLYLSVFAPHGPATPAPRHESLFSDAELPRTASFSEEDVSDKPAHVRDLFPVDPAAATAMEESYRNRLRSLQAVDEAVESVVQALEENGQLDETYIFFLSDNGYHMGEHRLSQNKQTAYEEDIHVPLLVRGPGVEAGSRIGDLVGNVDLAPTWAELAGVDGPEFVDGRSLVPLLRGVAPEEWRRAFLVEHWNESHEPRPGTTTAPTEPPRESLAALADPSPEYHGVRTADTLYVEYVTGEQELYDMEQDPAQLDNQAGSADADRLDALSDLVGRLQACAGEGCRSLESEPAP